MYNGRSTVRVPPSSNSPRVTRKNWMMDGPGVKGGEEEELDDGEEVPWDMVELDDDRSQS
jgi:hypothetical protein